ncbi:DnaD domain protein [Staphylococcus haemolyticus]|uniref:helix-turn-helix domain-containing protein n=1 Tax=Staphylococcus haemolyticus TaxID=1283 RepID=UPI000CEB3A3C|nr:helix-turn-helix domain-containing protein [Staphylococcus haemolyticus]AVH47423.1 DnaD domain protein [Staphylococcus haemolyticus]
MSDNLKSNVSGFGLVFKHVFKDENLDIEALGLYSYLCAYAGADKTSFPSVSLICKDLKISERRFKKYRKQLEDSGYLKVERKRTDKGFSNNIYTINHNPLSLQNVPLQNVPLQNVPLQNVGTTNNSITNNSITNNSETDNVGQALSLLFDNFITISQKTKSEIEFSLEDIGENAYDITQLAINYTKQQNKGINYLKAILNNWSKEKVKTVEQAQEKLSPNQRKTKQQQKTEEKNSFWENKLKGVSGNEW